MRIRVLSARTKLNSFFTYPLTSVGYTLAGLSSLFGGVWMVLLSVVYSSLVLIDWLVLKNRYEAICWVKSPILAAGAALMLTIYKLLHYELRIRGSYRKKLFWWRVALKAKLAAYNNIFQLNSINYMASIVCLMEIHLDLYLFSPPWSVSWTYLYVNWPNDWWNYQAWKLWKVKFYQYYTTCCCC